ncbi:MAG TPA: ABC transporter substrate-binding protein, partial [Dehalococcoidia bacterium]|nr:ABC transporter substrate-binding protein [Dehalococcoidia bacterium]
MQEQNYWTRLQRSRVSRRRFMAGSAAAVAGLAAAGIVGCSSSSTSDNKSTGTQTSGQPKRGGKLAFQYAIQPPHLDPHQTTSAGVGGTAGVAYSRLVRYKVTEMAKALIVEGDLAEKIEQPQPESYIFTLRKGVKWHNIPPVSGREFVANDVAYTFNRQNQLKVNSGFTESIDKITVINDYQVRVDLKRANADFLLNIASTRVP